MKISSRARHAVRLMLEVARLSDGRTPVKLSEITQISGLSQSFLEQLVIPLKSHSLIRGVCGRNGGYLLSKPSGEITIGDVLSAVTGPISLAVCADDPAVCMSSEFCSSRMVWALLQMRITEVLNEYSIADLLDANTLKEIDRELLNSDNMKILAARA
jgi:Rrf2 family transcriptional regulator, cysteine metabolism repressor